jgi:hypothetical protein
VTDVEERCAVLLWLGWTYLSKTVRKPQRGGVNFDPPMVFCACSMQNSLAASGMLPDDFRTKQKVLPPKRVLGAQASCGDVTSLSKNLVQHRTTNFRRQAIQEPIFSVANIDFEGGCDGRGCGVRHFFGQIGKFPRPNPAICIYVSTYSIV